MAIFVSTTCFGDGSQISEALSQFDKIGIKNIELGSNHSKFDINKLYLKKDNFYIFHNYFPPGEKEFVLNVASEDKNVRDKSIRFIKSSIDICNKLNIEYYTIHPGFFAEAISTSKNNNRNFDFVFKKSAVDRKKVLERTIKIIKNLYAVACKKNVKLLIENQGSITSRQFTIFDSPQELDFLKKEIGENLKFNFNLAHATLAGFKLEESKVFKHFYKNSSFFEVSEITNNFDSHLSVSPKKGKVGGLLEKYKKEFKNTNIILEYRNLPIEEVKKSYFEVFNFLNTS